MNGVHVAMVSKLARACTANAAMEAAMDAMLLAFAP
jgi:hypothetical protein